MQPPYSCPACGKGQVRPLAKPGRTFRHRELRDMPLPASFEIPTCDHCHEEWITPALETAINAALEQDYEAELRRRAARTHDGA